MAAPQRTETDNPKILIREATIPQTLPNAKPVGKLNILVKSLKIFLESGYKASDRYKKPNIEDGDTYSDAEGQSRNRNTTGPANQNLSTLENSLQLQNSALEKFFNQMKEDRKCKTLTT